MDGKEVIGAAVDAAMKQQNVLHAL